MLAALPGGQSLLSGVSPEEEAQYLEKGPQLGQREAVRAIRTLGNALEHMTRGSDQRIELELALFTLSEPPHAALCEYARDAPACCAGASPCARRRTDVCTGRASGLPRFASRGTGSRARRRRASAPARRAAGGRERSPAVG